MEPAACEARVANFVHFPGRTFVALRTKYFPGVCWAFGRCDFYRYLRALKRVLEITLRSWFLHLLTLGLKAFTCLLSAFNYGDHIGAYLVFGRNGGKHSLPISHNLLQIPEIDSWFSW